MFFFWGREGGRVEDRVGWGMMEADLNNAVSNEQDSYGGVGLEQFQRVPTAWDPT